MLNSYQAMVDPDEPEEGGTLEAPRGAAASRGGGHRSSSAGIRGHPTLGFRISANAWVRSLPRMAARMGDHSGSRRQPYPGEVESK